MSLSLLNKHNRLASTCPLSNLSPVFRPSIKRKIGIREAITQQREKRLPISYLALKLRYIKKIHVHKVELKSLYFRLVYVFLLSSKTRIYINKIHEVELKTPFQFCLTFSPFYLEEMKVLSFSRTVNQVIMRVHKPKVEYKFWSTGKTQGSTLTYYYKTNNLTRIN